MPNLLLLAECLWVFWWIAMDIAATALIGPADAAYALRDQIGALSAHILTAGTCVTLLLMKWRHPIVSWLVFLFIFLLYRDVSNLIELVKLKELAETNGLGGLWLGGIVLGAYQILLSAIAAGCFLFFCNQKKRAHEAKRQSRLL